MVTITTKRPHIFRNHQGHKFEISLEAVAQMSRLAQHLPQNNEAGGVMLGRFIIDTQDVVVDKVTIPLRGDKQSRFGFFRSRRPHQTVITQEWQKSGGTCNYLGEWHTHPESNPTPSFIDKSEWKKRLTFDRLDSECIYFVIVGTDKLNAWQGYRKTKFVEQLVRIP